jgi:hypothetical protein
MKELTTRHYIYSLAFAAVAFTLCTAAVTLLRAEGNIFQTRIIWWGPAAFFLSLYCVIFMLVGLPIAYAPFVGLLLFKKRFNLTSIWAYIVAGGVLGLLLTPISGLPFLLFSDTAAPSYLEQCTLLMPGMIVAGACAAISFHYLERRVRLRAQAKLKSTSVPARR